MRRRNPIALLGGLLAIHLLLGIGRIPGKALTRRLDAISNYEQQGAARFLLTRAQLDGTDELEWLLANTDDRCVVLWRWPCDGALELAAALLAPRLVVDERAVPTGSTTFADRKIAAGRLPSGDQGQFVIQGTDAQGLILTTRSN